MSSDPVRHDWLRLSDILLSCQSQELQIDQLMTGSGKQITLHVEHLLLHTGELNVRLSLSEQSH